jgi:hypothetical protein
MPGLGLPVVLPKGGRIVKRIRKNRAGIIKKYLEFPKDAMMSIQ